MKRSFHYEHRRQKLLSRPAFARRLARHGFWALLLVVGSVVLGTLGFHLTCEQSMIDAFVNACMLLGGMGPVGDPGKYPDSGKVFAALYALYAGPVFLVVVAFVLAPVFHRMLHRFHLDTKDDD